MGGGLNTGKMALAYRLHRRGLNAKTVMAVLLALASKLYNLVFSLICPWHLLSCCPSAGAQSVFKSESVRGIFKMSGFPAAIRLTWTVRILAGFYSKILWGYLFLALEPCAGEPWCGARAPRSSGATSVAEISVLMLNLHTWVQNQPISRPHGLFIALVMSYVQLVFRCFSRVILLKFSCNFNVVMAGGKHSVSLARHLGLTCPSSWNNILFIPLVYIDTFVIQHITGPSLTYSWESQCLGSYCFGNLPESISVLESHRLIPKSLTKS